VELDFGFCSHREAAAKLTRDRQTTRKLAEPPLSDRGPEQQKVVSERGPTQPRALPRQKQRNERKCDEEVEELAENEAAVFYGSGFYRGTSADFKISAITESGVTPSSSASARNVKR